MLMKFFLTGAAACCLLAPSVNAHIVITSPVPYGQDSLNNSPLDASGSDFPCKQRPGVYDITEMNNMSVGAPQKLAFKGGATHGGGSCQISVTMDKQPTKDSVWKVIYTILGGCPNSVPGNAGSSADYDGDPTFEYTIPKGMPNGQYTLAWTWFNKIGNREMYMNCAPISVTGGADNDDLLSTLPNMFEANIGNGCATTPDEDFDFPNPGKYVTTVETTALASSTSGTCAAATGGSNSASGYGSSQASPTSSSGAGAGSPSGYAGASSAAPLKSASYGSGAGASAGAGGSNATPSSAGGSAPSYGAQNQGVAGAIQNSQPQLATSTTMATVTMSSSANADAGTSTSAASVPSYGSSSSGTSPNLDVNGTSSGSCESGSVACSTDGSIVCIGSDQWGTCDGGCAVPMALAEGTSCSGGVISKREAMKHLRRHLVYAHKI